MACSKIPYETEQGIFFAEQGIFWREQGIFGRGRRHEPIVYGGLTRAEFAEARRRRARRSIAKTRDNIFFGEPRTLDYRGSSPADFGRSRGAKAAGLELVIELVPVEELLPGRLLQEAPDASEKFIVASGAAPTYRAVRAIGASSRRGADVEPR
jgi:hypothetical protein